MADEQHDQTASADYQPAAPDPAAPAQPPAEGSPAPPFEANPQAPVPVSDTDEKPPPDPLSEQGLPSPDAEKLDPTPPTVPNSSAPGATSSEAGTILKVDPPQHAEEGTVEPASTVVQPIHVDQRSSRSDDDALEGHFVDIVGGDYEGRRGTFDRVTEYGTDGYPKRILVITRDERNEYLDVPYEYARPTTYKGGR